MLSSYLEEATALLDRVRGCSLSMEERKKLTVDLASLILQNASRAMTLQEQITQTQLSHLMRDVNGKAFTTAVIDQCFRSNNTKRIADQLIYLINQFGFPQYVHFPQKLQLFLLKTAGPSTGQYLVPLMKRFLRKELLHIIFPADPPLFHKYLEERKKQKITLDIHRLGEIVLSDAEAKRRLDLYLDDIKNPYIDSILIKINTLCSPIHCVDFATNLTKLSGRLRQLYRVAMQYKTHTLHDYAHPKRITLDIEEYSHLVLMVTAFKNVLSEPEFHHYPAGIVLQSYLPESYLIQQELIEWAKNRVASGGAPISLRFVKGDNLGKEQVDASLKGWPQAPYTTKSDTDANYKRMLLHSCTRENAYAAHVEIASHNLFDIAFSMLLRLEKQIEPYVHFEMREGVAKPLQRIVQKFTQSLLLYCPISTKKELLNATSYLIRRLDENTGGENFLRYIFELKPGSETWENQAQLFMQSCDDISALSPNPRRTQNRFSPTPLPDDSVPFDNEAPTDFSLPQNQAWANDLTANWPFHTWPHIPCAINGKDYFEPVRYVGYSPSCPHKELFRSSQITHHHIEEAVSCAKKHQHQWKHTSIPHKKIIFARLARLFREQRGLLVKSIMMESGKTIEEADQEVSHAIDFAEYYRHQIDKFFSMKDLHWSPRGTVLVVSSAISPCAIPVGNLIAALITGNCVLFKPSSHALLTGWNIAQLFWQAGLPKETLQFLPCHAPEIGDTLISHPLIDRIILTGSTHTARHFLQKRRHADCIAEAGSKNSMIITALADRYLAIKDLITSAFTNAGQSCAATSLAILDAEVYDDPKTQTLLREATSNLTVGLSYHLSTQIPPLKNEASGALLRGLTLLESGEEWLLKPKQDPCNPLLWSPGIKWNVQPYSFTHLTEFCGPILAVLRAKDLHHAIELANAVPYGLSAGLHSLDEREQLLWIEEIEAGNLYINKSMMDMIVRRQPFGGIKASQFGASFKRGGPNHLYQFMKVEQIDLPREKFPVNEWVNSLTPFLEKIDLSAEQLGLWMASVSNYAYWWKRLQQDRDPSKILGEDNYLRYAPRYGNTLRLDNTTCPLDALRICAAALTCRAELEISWSRSSPLFNWLELIPIVNVIEETDAEFLQRLRAGKIARVRTVGTAPLPLYEAAAISGTCVIDAPVLANGRIELLHFLREISISIAYHRYGNLGLREGELRKPLS